MIDEKEVVDNTQNGECIRCGECCGLFVPFTEKELKTIKKYVKQNKILPTDRINKYNGSMEGRCCFYNIAERKCNIYPVRPKVCRDFMCNHKDWRERREKYAKYGTYNSSYNGNKLLTFDDAIYDNYEPLIRTILALATDEDGCDAEKVIKVINYLNRRDLIDKFVAYGEDKAEIKIDSEGKVNE